MINKITLIGNIGQDAELRTTQSGDPFAYFRLATNKGYKDSQGNWQKATEWHSVKVWGAGSNRAASMLKKGALVYIEGQLVSYQKSKDASTLWEIRAQTWRLLDQKPDQLLPPEPTYNQQPFSHSPWGNGSHNK
jgi:single-strand DNA-binding protein